MNWLTEEVFWWRMGRKLFNQYPYPYSNSGSAVKPMVSNSAIVAFVAALGGFLML